MIKAVEKVLRMNINKSNRVFRFFLDFNKDNCIEIYTNNCNIHIMEHNNYLVIEKAYQTAIVDLNEIKYFEMDIL